MYKYTQKWKNRRSAHGLFMPTLFLVFEMLFYAVSIYLVSQFNIFILTLLSVVVAFYFFITSSLPRYKSVCHRQKFQNKDNTLMS